MLNLLMEQIKTLVEVSNNLNERTREVEKRLNEITVDTEKSKEESKIMNEKMDMMEKNMEKFIGLYEVVTNQYNPFLESSGSTEVEEEEEIADSSTDNNTNNNADNTAAPQAPSSNNPSSPQQDQTTAAQNVPTASPYSAQDAAAADQVNGAASFNFEDRITGEKGFVGQADQNQGQSPQQQYGNQQHGSQQYGNNPAQNLQGNMGQQGNTGNFNPQGNFAPQNPPNLNGQAQNNNQNANLPPYQGPDMRSNNPLFMPTQKKISTLQDLLEELAIMDDNSFYGLVNGQRNEIANWVMNSLGNLELGTEILKCRTRIETIKTLSRHIHSRPPEPSQPIDFRFNNGKMVNDIEGMLDELIYIDDAVFSSHVNPQKNDIADWLKGSLHKDALADKVRNLTRKTDVIRELALFLHNNN